MATTKKIRAGKARTTAPGAAAAGTTAPSGGAAGGVTAGTTTGPGGGTLTQGTAATTATSGYGTLGFFTVDAEGATVHFGIDQQEYVLAASAPNYNALFAMLLACWLEARRVNLTYALPLLTANAAADGPRRILSLVTI